MTIIQPLCIISGRERRKICFSELWPLPRHLYTNICAFFFKKSKDRIIYHYNYRLCGHCIEFFSIQRKINFLSHICHEFGRNWICYFTVTNIYQKFYFWWSLYCALRFLDSTSASFLGVFAPPYNYLHYFWVWLSDCHHPHLLFNSSGSRYVQEAVGTPLSMMARLNRTLLPGEITWMPRPMEAELSANTVNWKEEEHQVVENQESWKWNF